MSKCMSMKCFNSDREKVYKGEVAKQPPYSTLASTVCWRSFCQQHSELQLLHFTQLHLLLFI